MPSAAGLEAFWIFDCSFLHGRYMRPEEPSWQRCEGDRIAEQEFFYDLAQMKPR